MIEFLLSPILSLFSPRFYQGVLKSSLAKGFLYLAYLSLIGALAFILIIQLKWVPAVDNFVAWFAEKMPPVTVENGTLSSPVKQPYIVIHPKFKKILILDTTKEKVDLAEAKEAFVYATKRFVYISNPFQSETRVIDVGEQTKDKSVPSGPHVVTGELAQKFYQQIKPIFLGILFAFTFGFIFLWKLIAAIFYSLIAAVLNLFREDRFSYERLLNLSIFAMTAVTLIQFLNAVVTSIHAPVPLWVALALTTCYLGLVILVISPPEQPVN